MAEDEDVDPDQQGERQEAHHQAVDAEHCLVRSYSGWTKQLAKLTRSSKMNVAPWLR